MATKNSCDNGSLRSADTVICESLKGIKRDKKTAESRYTSNYTLQQSKETARGYKICCLDKAEESHNVYQDIMSCVTLENYKKSEIIQKNIDAYIKKDDDIDKLINDTSKLLNEMRIKIEEAHNAACAMSNCIKNKVLPKSGKPSKDGKIGEVEHELKEILDKTKELDEKGQNAFESVVTIAGIHTFTNTVSLKGFAAKLMDSVKNFKACVDTNIKSTATDVVTSREELNTIVEELAQIICDKKTEAIIGNGLESVIEFVCESDCEDGCIDLCKDIKNCYDSDENSDQKKKDRRRRKQSNDKN